MALLEIICETQRLVLYFEPVFLAFTVRKRLYIISHFFSYLVILFLSQVSNLNFSVEPIFFLLVNKKKDVWYILRP